MADINSTDMELQRTPNAEQKKLVLEINYVLPDNKPRIVSVENSLACVGISDISLSGDIAEFGISAQIDLIYNALAVSEDEEHLFCTACRISKTFKETADIEKVNTDDEIKAYHLEINVNNIEVTLISDRKVNIKIHSTLTSHANTSYHTDCVQTFSNKDIVCKNKYVSGIKCLGSKRVQSRISEDIEIDRSLPEIDNILCKNVSVQIENKKVTDGKIIFYGTAHIDTVFSSSGSDDNFYSTGFDVNFNQACDFNDINESTKCSISYDVTDVSLDAKSDGIITVEMLLSFDVKAYNNYEFNVIEDAFLPTAVTITDKCDLTFENNILINENIGICTDKFNIEDSGIDKILMSSVTVKECTSYIKNKNVYFDGIYDIKTVYVPQNDKNSIKIATVQTPFSYMPQTQASDDCIITGNVFIKGITSQKNDYGEIVVKWVADIEATATNTVTVNAIKDLTVTDEKVSSERNIYYHFIGENESLWDISKRFGVPPAQICELNNINENDDITQLKGVIIMVNRE